ncbi:glycosyltransferase [Petrachloros mirabilis]
MEPLALDHSLRSISVSDSSDKNPTWIALDSRLVIAVISVFCMIVMTIFRFGPELVDPLAHSLRIQGWAAILVRPSLLWFAMGMVLLVVRTVLWIRYRPVAPISHGDAPKLSIIIPAYNEGSMVRKAIDSCVMADYPSDRLEILVVDDGSTDDTWTHIEGARRERPDVIQAIRLSVNSGKRAALAAGFSKATGDIFVTVDSDSMVEQGALLAIAGPFRNARVGVVAGKVCVLNRFSSLLPRMLHVRFVLSFDFLRAVQSTYGTVYCCPGALSAYRAAVIKPLIPAWLKQRFLGEICTIGEDRALTNDVLAAGYRAVYQRSAVVHTTAPETYRKLCRMFLRWDRSYIREELRLWKIVWRLPFPAMVLTFLESTISNLRYPVAYSSLGLMIYLSLQDPLTIVRVLVSIAMVSLFYSLYFLHSERSREFVFGVLYAYFHMFALVWIFPVAFITVRNRSWMTR